MRHALAATAILCLMVVSGLQGQEGPYHAGKDIPIGGDGGWDPTVARPRIASIAVTRRTSS
jgi:hypothetical protein